MLVSSRPKTRWADNKTKVGTRNDHQEKGDGKVMEKTRMVMVVMTMEAMNDMGMIKNQDQATAKTRECEMKARKPREGAGADQTDRKASQTHLLQKVGKRDWPERVTYEVGPSQKQKAKLRKKRSKLYVDEAV